MNTIIVEPTDALLIIDVQNTFCPGGTLPVADGNAVIAPLNAVMPFFGGRVYASQDYHPANHCSFKAQGGIWEPHAVQNTADAALHPALNRNGISQVVQKGTLADRDAYSAFDGTGLADTLRDHGVRRVFIGGLATDYCVKATALDAVREGFIGVVLTDACRAVNVSPGDGDAALAEMRSAGVGIETGESLSGS